MVAISKWSEVLKDGAVQDCASSESTVRSNLFCKRMKVFINNITCVSMTSVKCKGSYVS